MDDKQLEERLDLLKSSYNRVPSSFNADEVLQKIEKEIVQPPPSKQSKGTTWQKVTVWAVGIASLFVVGILGGIYLSDERASQGEGQLNEANKEFVEKLKKGYPIEREKRREMLNLSEEEFTQIEFIRSADSSFEHITNPRYGWGFINAPNIDAEYEQQITHLKLPSEMVKEVVEQDSLDKAETIEFLGTYHLKVNYFKEYANKQLDAYKDELSAYKVDGIFNMNEILENERLLPAGFQNLRKNAESQGLKLEIVDEGIDVVFRYNYVQNLTDFSKSLDPISNAYLLMMAFEPFTSIWEFIYPMDETATTLMKMEEYFLDDYITANYRGSIMDTYYTSVFYLLVKGTRENPVFDDNGLVKEEYQNMWMSMANNEAISPSPYLLIPIVNEFEQTGWTKSEAWDDFTYAAIEDALLLAKSGDMEQFMPVPLEDMSKGVLVNDDFQQRVHALYKLFAGSHDQTVLKDATPEEIVGLYYYCMQLGDYETQYELYIKDEQYQRIPKEEYMSGPHEKISDIQKEFSSFRFDQRSDKEGYVVLTLNPENTLYSNDQVVGFAVIYTDNGWRAAFMPTQ
ncbi:hypothetical protein [Psychrobacillus sp.]|uniref:hypothetical protein n=1 Tax=Psychrobacillus sp. TaxID=1871623 RepID=UPI0028BE1EC5|nr:hypothetical protein [Psychrobacillus sp.]